MEINFYIIRAGKSTQLPQFILRHYKHQGRKHLNMRRPNIIVTQPRRIAV
jgi:HrpA-like RNA helicase